MSRPRRTGWRRRWRAAAGWLAGAFVVSQAALSVWIDQRATAVRDPEYARLERMMRDRASERPGKPVALFVGSSRVAHGFDATAAVGPNEVVLFNFGMPGAGPYLQEVLLDRLRAAGLRADILFLELMPAFFNAAGPKALDLALLDGARLSAAEAAGLWDSGARSKTAPLRRWVCARALPINRHRAEMRDLVGLDVYRSATGPVPRGHPIDPAGFRPWEKAPAECAELTAVAHRMYDPFYAAFRLDAGPWGRLLRAIHRAGQDGTEAAVVLMPEGSEFRRLYTPEVRAGVTEMIRALREDAGVPVVDARDWLADSAFHDQHHLNPAGARAFAERFRAEALGPALARRRARQD